MADQPPSDEAVKLPPARARMLPAPPPKQSPHPPACCRCAAVEKEVWQPADPEKFAREASKGRRRHDRAPWTAPDSFCLQVVY